MIFWLNTEDRKRSRSKFSNSSQSRGIKKASSQKNGTKHIQGSQFQSSFEKQSQINNQKNIKRQRQQRQQRLDQRNNIKQRQVGKIDPLKQLFNKYDQDKDGILSIIEFQNLMYKGKQMTSLQTSNLIFNRVKKQNSKGIKFEDFAQILSKQDYSLDSQKSLKDAFLNFDKNNKGYFELQDYLIVCRDLDQKFNSDELKQAFINMDADKNGKVTFDQFKKAISC